MHCKARATFWVYYQQPNLHTTIVARYLHPRSVACEWVYAAGVGGAGGMSVPRHCNAVQDRSRDTTLAGGVDDWRRTGGRGLPPVPATSKLCAREDLNPVKYSGTSSQGAWMTADG